MIPALHLDQLEHGVRSALSEDIVVVNPGGPSEFAAALEALARACDRVASARDAFASGIKSGRISGETGYSLEEIEAAQAANRFVRKLNPDKIAGLAEGLLTGSVLPALPIEQPAELVRQERALIRAGISYRKRGKILRARGWDLE